MNKRWITAATTFGAATMVFGAAALAQTPPTAQTPTPGATATRTGTPVATVTGTRTVVVTGTVTPGATGTVAVGTPVPTIAVPASLYVPGGGPFAFADPAFERVWTRTDRLVREGRVSRTWFWGPGPNTPGLLEPYREAPGGAGTRLVQYFDKSRMEINNPAGNRADPFFVTNGLLTTEMIAGRIQVGNNTFVDFHSPCIPMTGDFGDQIAPTYFAFQKVSSVESGNNPAPNRVGQRATETIDRNGNVGTDATKSSPQVELTAYFTETRHNVPRVFMDFLNSSGPIYNNNNQVVNGRLIDPLVFVTGYPISEPYWTRATIQGRTTDVLIQAYQRRALTYVPTNPQGFQVEMANIGQHYFDWRYRNFGYCAGTPARTPTAPVPAPTGTAVPGTPGATTTPGTPGATVTPGTPGATVTPGTPGATTTPAGTVTAVATIPNDPKPTGTVTGTPVGPVGTPPVGTPVP